MKTIVIESKNDKATNVVEEFLIKGSCVFVKGLNGVFKTPFATDNGEIVVNGEIWHVGDGSIFAKPIKWQLVDEDKERFDEVYEIFVR